MRRIAAGWEDTAELHGLEFKRADEAGLVDLGPPYPAPSGSRLRRRSRAAMPPSCQPPGRRGRRGPGPSVVSSRHMKRIAAAILVLCVLFGAGAVRGEQEPAPSITVVGSGTAAAPPDTAEVTAGVVTQAATAAQALTQNSVAMAQVLKALTGLGIAERDVRTSAVSVMPQRAEPQPGRRQAPAIVGYEVTNQVHVKVRNIAILGRLLDTLVGQGANTVGSIA